MFKTLFVLFLLIASCARAPLKDYNNSMRRVDVLPQILDDHDYNSLRQGIHKNVDFFKKSKKMDLILKFGPESITVKDYVKAIESVMEKTKNMNFDEFKSAVIEQFDFFEVYGDKDWGDVFITSYFEPVINGSKRKTKKHSQPLYELPNDMVFIDLNAFIEDMPQLEEFQVIASEKKIKNKKLVLRGRVVERSPLPRIIPYWDRESIDSNRKLMKSNKTKILAWVDPIDAFFLHIQGSGTVVFNQKQKIRVGYAGQNGHEYIPIGKYLFDVIPREEMTAHKIEDHLRNISKEQATELLNKNPSYVFFRELSSKAITYIGSEVVDGRTIATDSSIFPKGVLGFMQFEKPVFAKADDVTPSQWVKSSRFVFDQDRGGAIQGPGRVDLFWGTGPEAKQAAGVMKNRGKLYYLFPKKIKQSKGL